MAKHFFRKVLTLPLIESPERKLRAIERASDQVFRKLAGLLGYAVWTKDDSLMVEGPDVGIVRELISTAKGVCGGMPSRTVEVTTTVDDDVL